MGFVKTIVNVGIAASLLYAGYVVGKNSSGRCGYLLVSRGGQCYLQEKATSKEEPIYAGLQVGSIQHRVDGLFNAPTDQFGELEAAIYSAGEERGLGGQHERMYGEINPRRSMWNGQRERVPYSGQGHAPERR